MTVVIHVQPNETIAQALIRYQLTLPRVTEAIENDKISETATGEMDTMTEKQFSSL